MQTINLREFYPEIYQEDYFIAVPEELAQELDSFRRSENAFRVNTYRHQAYYSLERGEGIDQDILLTVATPDELHEEKVTRQQLHAAISHMPESRRSLRYANLCLLLSGHGRTRNCRSGGCQPAGYPQCDSSCHAKSRKNSKKNFVKGLFLSRFLY